MIVEASDLACGWVRDKPVQRFVNFTVSSGEVCCILGPNGCGKTTLMKTMMGLIPSMGGRVVIDGTDVAKMSPKERSRAIAYVSQGHTPPFTYRVRDVVLLGRVNRVGLGQPSARDAQIADQALADMGVADLAERFYTDISGGELQLVMIARALTQQPQMLVLDEPTAALDYGNAMRVIGKVRELAEMGYGVLMTTHSPDHAFMLDSNVVLLQRDRPMQFGRAVDVITERNMRDAYGVEVETKEFLTRDGGVVRMCAPLFSKMGRSGGSGGSDGSGGSGGSGDTSDATGGGSDGSGGSGTSGGANVSGASGDTSDATGGGIRHNADADGEGSATC